MASPPQLPRPKKVNLPHVLPAPRSSARGKVSAQVAPRGSSQEIDLGAAVAEALFGATPRHRSTGLLATPEGEAMQPVVGSVLHFVPAATGWVANLQADGEDEDKIWQEPVIGWVCVVTWTAWSPENEDEATKGTQQFQTEVQPITMMEDGQIETLVMREDVTLVGLVMPGQVLIARSE